MVKKFLTIMVICVQLLTVSCEDNNNGADDIQSSVIVGGTEQSMKNIGLEIFKIVQLSETEQDVQACDSELNSAIYAYLQFLQGKRIIQKANGYTLSINDIFEPDKDVSNKYTLFDMTGNGIPELHLQSTNVWGYTVISYKDGKLHEIYGLPHDGSLKITTLLNNGAILYKFHGSVPSHNSYAYIELDADGNEEFKIYFEEYDGNYDNKYDTFFFKDEKVSESEWKKLTEPYLSVNSDHIEWVEYSCKDLG